MPRPRGRPRKQIDQNQFEQLCALQCTLEDIAFFFHCKCVDTIESWCKRTYNENFSDVYKKYSVRGKISLRRMQFKLAEKSPAMAIFLGKQYLGQTDVVSQEITGANGEPIQTETVHVYLPDNGRK